MKPADPLGGLLPPAPPGRDLPHHDRDRRELLAVIRAEHRARRRLPAAPWLAPVGAALAVLVIVAGVFLLPAVFRDARHRVGATPAASGPPAAGGGHSRPLQRTQSYLVSSHVGRILLRADVGAVSITGADRSTISITAHLVYRGRAPVVTRRVTHHWLDLGYACPPGSRDCGVSFDLTVPRRIGAILRLGVGDIRLSGLAGVISAYTSTGRIQASGMATQTIVLDTGTGMISAGFTVPPQLVYARANTGSIGIRVPSGTAYKVTASTQVGSVRVAVAQAAASSHVIRATTGTGTVTVTGS